MCAQTSNVEYLRGRLNVIISSLNNKDPGFADELFEEFLDIMAAIKEQQIYDLKNEVYQLVSSDNYHVREEAVATLGFPNRLHLPEFKDIAYEIFLNDPSDIVKSTALSAWCTYYHESKNKDVIKKLYYILRNDNNAISIRADAHGGIFSTISLRHPDYDRNSGFDKLLNCKTQEEFNRKVNWEAIHKIMRQYAPEAL